MHNTLTFTVRETDALNLLQKRNWPDNSHSPVRYIHIHRWSTTTIKVHIMYLLEIQFCPACECVTINSASTNSHSPAPWSVLPSLSMCHDVLVRDWDGQHCAPSESINKKWALSDSEKTCPHRKNMPYWNGLSYICDEKGTTSPGKKQKGRNR
jgi:hypothetical protein